MPPERFEYSVYGLAIGSNRPLPGLRRGDGEGIRLDVDFAGMGDVPAPPGPPFASSGVESVWHLGDRGWLLRYFGEGGAAYPWSLQVLGGGSELKVRWSAEFQLLDIPSFLPGAGFTAALQLKGALTLHASAVAVDDRAVLILGVSGAGKSTTAAAFVSRGYPMVSDDVAVLDPASGSLGVQCGPTRLRIGADAARAAGWTGELPRLFHHPLLGDKRYIDLPEESRSREPRPLAAAYLLEPRLGGEGVRISPIPPAAAVGHLLTNLYRGGFLDDARARQAVRQCAAVARAVPLRAIRAADDLAQLPPLIDAIVDDVRRLPRPARIGRMG
jgi:hypothetical protein